MMTSRAITLPLSLVALVLLALPVLVGYLVNRTQAAATNEEIMSGTMTSAELKQSMSEDLASFEARLEVISEALAQADTDEERDEVEAELATTAQDLFFKLAIYNAAIAKLDC